MSKGLPIVTGYSTFEVRIRAVRAVLSGEVNVTETAITFGVDRSTVHRWIGRFQSEGEAGLVRAEVSGRPRKIEALDTEALCKIVLCPASQFGFETDFWTTPRLIQIVAEKFGVSLSKQSMMRRLHEAGMTYQKPERVYFEMSEEVRQKWRRTELRKIRAAVKNYKAILYFQDEANVSLTALLGKTWAIRGQTPKQRVTGNRGGVSAMSAITSGGQLIFRLHDKRIASDEVIDFLSQMLRHHPRRHLVVVMDQAAPHVSKKTKCFIENQRRLHVFYLPAYSPDWNPDEKVWNHLKHQELKGHQAKTKLELKTLADEKLCKMASDPELLRGIFFRCCGANILAA